MAAGLTGILIARSLGPAARGEYAAIMAWFGMTLVIGEVGQTAATTFFVASDRLRARDYVATSRNLMVATGVIALIAGFFCAPLLAGGDTEVRDGYRLMFASCIFSFVGASLIFSLQAVETARWNLVRVFQPLAFASTAWILYLFDLLTTVLSCLAVTSATMLMQAVLAYFICRASRLTGGKADRMLGKKMSRYGVAQLASAAPAVIVARLDVLVLSLVIDPALLGHYAVATSLTGLAVPLVTGIGSVIFPKIASQRDSDGDTTGLEKKALLATATLSGTIAFIVAASAYWVVPGVFGPEYRAAVPIVLILAPGIAALALSQVCGDILRGLGHPMAVARTQWAAAVTTAVAIAALMPSWGVLGAASALTLSALVGMILLLVSLHRKRRQKIALSFVR